jgi:hypothetical protein
MFAPVLPAVFALRLLKVLHPLGLYSLWKKLCQARLFSLRPYNPALLHFVY